MRTFFVACATMMMVAAPVFAEDAPAVAPDKNCLPDMNAEQCASWKAFWPRFQLAVGNVYQVMSEGPTLGQPMTKEYLETWNAEHAAKLDAAQRNVAELTLFPFKDYYRTVYKTYGAPVNVETPAQFAAMYEYIFRTDVTWSIKMNKVACQFHVSGDGDDKPNCNSIHLLDVDNQIGLEFVRNDEGEYRLSEVPYVE